MGYSIYKRIHVRIKGVRTTVNVNLYLGSLFLRKRIGEKTDHLNMTDINISNLRNLIQREIDFQNKNEFHQRYRRDGLKDRIEEFLINEIADPRLLE